MANKTMRGITIAYGDPTPMLIGLIIFVSTTINVILLPTTLVVQVEQSVRCVFLSMCPDNKFVQNDS